MLGTQQPQVLAAFYEKIIGRPAEMEENARQNPNKVLEVKRAIAEGEFVAVHSHVRQQPDDLGAAVVHIFRFEQDRIVELWDLGQPVPE